MTRNRVTKIEKGKVYSVNFNADYTNYFTYAQSGVSCAFINTVQDLSDFEMSSLLSRRHDLLFLLGKQEDMATNENSMEFANSFYFWVANKKTNSMKLYLLSVESVTTARMKICFSLPQNDFRCLSIRGRSTDSSNGSF